MDLIKISEIYKISDLMSLIETRIKQENIVNCLLADCSIARIKKKSNENYILEVNSIIYQEIEQGTLKHISTYLLEVNECLEYGL